jgi:cytochrome c oxidase subunit 4
MRTYTLTFVALLVLTTLTLGLSFAPLGVWHVPTAMMIAAAKTLLVAVFFMHLFDHGTSSWVAMLVAILLMLILVVLTALDVVSRYLALPG